MDGLANALQLEFNLHRLAARVEIGLQSIKFVQHEKQMAKKRSTGRRTASRANRSGTRSTADSRAEMARARGVVRGLELHDGAVERGLLLDLNRDAIASVVGDEYAEQLRQLALEANRVRSRGGKRVLILPGILGSTLAVGDDTIWFDPIDIARRKLKLLSLDGGATNVVSNGVFWPTYTELYLKLRIAGLRPEYFHFDWRKPIADAGKLLAARVTQVASSDQPVSLVAHSMGGLVSRAGLKLLGAKADSLVSETVLLGTPNLGSYAPAMVFTNDYSTVQWMERLDLVNASGALTKDVFTTFIGLTEMLPEPNHANGLDLFDVNAYPTLQRAVRKDVLNKAAGLQSRLSGGSSKVWMFAGVGLPTVVGVEAHSSDPAKFQYSMSDQGDETVPLALSHLHGANHRYCQVSHGALPRTNEVIKATIDVLKSGATSRLSTTADEATRAAVRSLAASARSVGLLQRAVADGRSGFELTDQDLRAALEPLLSVESRVGRIEADAASLTPSEQPIVIGRKYQTRLDLRLTLGDIGEAQGRAVMLGVFKDVRPGGAAGAVDVRLGGMLAEIIDRRMFSANVGELFVLPTPRHALAADMVVLIGLGNFSQFNLKSLRSSVENATRTLLRCQVDELVTVPMGGGSGLAMDEIVEAIIEGLQAALKDARGRPSLRGLEITTNNSTDFDHLCGSVLTLASSRKFDDMEFTLDRVVKPTDRSAGVIPATTLTTKASTSYLIVRETPNPQQSKNSRQHFVDVSILGSGAKATVLSDEVVISVDDLQKLLTQVNMAHSGNGFFAKATSLGQQLSELVLPPMIREVLSQTRPDSLTVINDFWGSKLPWELLAIGDWKAGLEGNVSRKYATANISVAKWLHERRAANDLSMLLVVNPTSDLPGAADEGKRVEQMVKGQAAMKLTTITESEATKTRLAEEFSSGKYDLVHYAGHAYFDEANRSQSGILCAGNQVLSGRDLATLDSLPSLVVFNACESARVRSAAFPTRMASPRKNARTSIASLSELVDRNVSLAEAFLRGGVGAFVGTYWEVGDAAASLFAETFYTNILSGHSVGASLRSAREKLHKRSEADWVNYIHYGDADFRIKTNP